METTSKLCAAQGAFYLATGIWPLVSRRTFEAVTGPKTDFWLVKTVGVMVAVIGGTLLTAGRRERVTPEIAWLAAGAAAGFVAIDTWYVSRGRIAPVYLADAALEAGLLGLWARVRRRGARARASAPRAAPPARPLGALPAT